MAHITIRNYTSYLSISSQPQRNADLHTGDFANGCVMMKTITSITRSAGISPFETLKLAQATTLRADHDDIIKWKHFPRYWPFVREFTGHR